MHATKGPGALRLIDLETSEITTIIVNTIKASSWSHAPGSVSYMIFYLEDGGIFE